MIRSNGLRTGRVLVSTVGAVVQEMRTKRSTLAIEAGVICLNNVMWIVFWSIFFQHTGSIRGWDRGHTLLLFAVSCTVFGISSGFFDNARRLTHLMQSGQLDNALTLPVDPLSYLLLRRINPFGIGDFVFGIVLFVIVQRPSPLDLGMFAATVTLGAVVLTAFAVIIGALTMLRGGHNDHAALFIDAASVFSIYPISVFGGVVKVLLFTVLPVAFMVAIPVDVLRSDDGSRFVGLAYLALAAAVSSTLARVLFDRALRRYRSGSQWTVG